MQTREPAKQFSKEFEVRAGIGGGDITVIATA
jgi:hypothetical protein